MRGGIRLVTFARQRALESCVLPGAPLSCAHTLYAQQCMRVGEHHRSVSCVLCASCGVVRVLLLLSIEWRCVAGDVARARCCLLQHASPGARPSAVTALALLRLGGRYVS